MPDPDTLLPLLTAGVPSDPTVRADGGAVAFVRTDTDLDGDRRVTCVCVVDVRGGPVAATAGPADRHPRHAPLGDVLAFIRPDEQGVDQVVTWPDGDALTRLEHPVRSFTWSPDATRLAVVATRHGDTGGPLIADGPAYKRDGAGWVADEHEVLVVDTSTGSTNRVVGPLPAIGDVAWTHDGDALLVALPHDPASWRWDLHRVTIADGRSTVLTRHGEWERVACPIGLPDGDVLYVGGEAGPRHAHLRRLSSGALAPGLDRNVTVGMPAYPGAPPVVDGDRVLFTANDHAVSRLCSMPHTGGLVTWHTPPGTVVTGAAAAAGVVVLTEATSTVPGAVRVLDGPTLWSAPVIDLPWTVESFDVTGDDGRVVPCTLLRSRAAGDGPAPTLVDLHGGPHNVSNGALGAGNLHRWLLAERGWHVLLPNVRGSDGYGEAWYRGLEPGGGWASDDLADVHTVVDAAVGRGLADPARLAVHGYSYGGLLVAALTSTTDVFAAAAMGGAPVDLGAFVASADLPVALWRREVGGVPWADDAFDRRSPIRRAAAVRTPTLVLHGTADQRVPVSQGEAWFRALQDNGVPSRLVLHPGASHGFVTAGAPRTVLDVGRRVADWLERWTPPATGR